MTLDLAERGPALAGLAAVVAAAVPWSVSVSTGGFSRSVALRFGLGSLRLDFGPRSVDVTRTVVPVTALDARYGDGLASVATLWSVAAALLVAAVVVGVALLVAGDRLETGPLDPVRLVGGLCVAMALALSGATWLLWQRAPGTPIPVGVVALYLFGGGLLAVERDRTRAGGASG